MNKLIISQPGNGLGNRLRNLSSCYIYAQEAGIPLQVQWDLFDKFWTSTLSFCELDLKKLREDGVLSEYKGVQVCFPGTAKKIQRDCSNFILIGGGQSFKLPTMTTAKYNSLKSDFYNSLIPHKEISEAAAAYVKENFEGRRILGVQLRGGDRGQHKEKMSLPTASALEIIDKYVMDFDALFLTSNDDTLLSLALDHYSQHKTLLFTRSLPVSSDPTGGGAFWQNAGKIHQMREDLIEWYILSQVDKLIYSHESSFAYEALFLNKKTNAVELTNPNRKNPSWENNIRPLIYA